MQNRQSHHLFNSTFWLFSDFNESSYLRQPTRRLFVIGRTLISTVLLFLRVIFGYWYSTSLPSLLFQTTLSQHTFSEEVAPVLVAGLTPNLIHMHQLYSSTVFLANVDIGGLWARCEYSIQLLNPCLRSRPIPAGSLTKIIM